MAESKIIFYEGTQEEYDSSSKDENGIYFITDNKAIYKGPVKYSGESEIATPASPGVIKPGESFEVSSDGTLNLVGIPNTLFTPVKEEMKTEINKAVSESGHLKREVVDSLPLSGIDNVIYMKSKSGEEDNIYDEYMWINQKWERIGSSEVDLSNYPTKQALEESMTRTLTEAKQYTDQEKSKYVPLAGNVSISNQIAMNAEPASAKHIATKQYVDNINASMIEAENRRETAEGKREASEVKRATAESQRALAETERVSSENARKEAETARVTAEQARQTAEENRSQTFSNSLASWEQQVSAETTKANQATAEANKAVATANKASETANTAINKMNETLERVPIVAENILTGTATGVIAHADDVYTSKALGLNVYGKSSQYTTTGANLANLDGVWVDSNGATHEVKKPDSVVVRCEKAWARSTLFIPVPQENKDYTCSATMPSDSVHRGITFGVANSTDGSGITKVQGLNPSNQYCAKINVADEKYFAIAFYGNNTSEIGNFEMVYKNVMIALGSTAVPYEEYTGGKPTPHPDYPRDIVNVKNADITIAEKNLLPRFTAGSVESNGFTYTLQDSNSFAYEGTSNGKVSYYYPYNTTWGNQTPIFSLKPGTYTVSAKKGALPLFGMRGKTKNGEVKTITDAALNTPQAHFRSFTLSETTYITHVQLSITTGGSNNGVQCLLIEAGSTATEYEPYQEPITLPIDLQGNELCSLPNGVRDEVRIDKDGNAVLVKRVAKVSLKDYVSNLIFANTWGENKNVFIFSDMKIGAKISKADVSDNLRCDAFSASYGNTIYKGTVKTAITGFNSFLHSQNENIIVVCEEAENLEQFKALLIAKNPVVYFELAEPIIIPLGKVDIPTLPAPVCNAWANNENPTDMKFSYIRDVNIAYEKLASALANAMNTPATIPELEL